MRSWIVPIDVSSVRSLISRTADGFNVIWYPPPDADVTS
jgi:hypothetical protein